MNLLIDIMLVAIAVSLSCSIIGVFLVLKGATMVSDAITHTVLLGIVLGYFVTQDMNSPFLMVGATLVGVLTVYLIETLRHTNLVDQDAATGIVFPFLFSIAIILITRFAGDVHLDTDAVFAGEIGFTVFDRFTLSGIDIGPKAFWRSIGIFFLNCGFVYYFYKELQVAIFDPNYAKSLGISVTAIHYLLMALTSLTAVGSFEAVGSILVVGLIVGPALTGFLWSDKLEHVIAIALVTAVFNAVAGVYIAYQIDLSYSGIIATVTGCVALLSFIFSPKKGALRQWFNRNKQQKALKEAL
ncbi:metal ABC transporter permease [Aerococcaceae bacterium DSM 111020]|nr:metal ABC transporter permease [Aerococcaceae bacterium DSM 111020]